jgi:hypothetical protein
MDMASGTNREYVSDGYGSARIVRFDACFRGARVSGLCPWLVRLSPSEVMTALLVTCDIVRQTILDQNRPEADVGEWI